MAFMASMFFTTHEVSYDKHEFNKWIARIKKIETSAQRADYVSTANLYDLMQWRMEVHSHWIGMDGKSKLGFGEDRSGHLAQNREKLTWMYHTQVEKVIGNVLKTMEMLVLLQTLHASTHERTTPV